MNKIFYQIKNWAAHWRALVLGSFITIDRTLGEYVFGAPVDSTETEGVMKLSGQLNACLLYTSPSPRDA